MYQKNKKGESQRVGLEKTKFILGSFDFSSPFDDKLIQGINIAAIPISVDFFMKWFTDNVISQGQTRKSFPILTFVRNLCNNLLGPSLLENCVNKDEVKTLRFSTGQISAYSKSGDPLTSFSKSQKIIKLPNYDKFPLVGTVGGFEDNKINNFYTYLTLMVHGGGLTYDGTGVYSQDVRNGRYHIDIGSNKGIVKKINFSKTDMQYIREARFFQHGFDGLMQLSNVYKATIEMFGNTLFYPGNELFINPYGFGGPALGRPQDGAGPDGTNERSLANILGLGGYHTIISIKSTITPGDYSTTIQAQQYYTGDGSGNPNLNGKKRLSNLRKRKQKKLEETHTTGDSPTGNACDKIIVDQLYADVLINESERLRSGERPYVAPRKNTQIDLSSLEAPPRDDDTTLPNDTIVEVDNYTEELDFESGITYRAYFQPTAVNDDTEGPFALVSWDYDRMIVLEEVDGAGVSNPVYEYSLGEEIVANITVYNEQSATLILEGDPAIYEAFVTEDDDLSSGLEEALVVDDESDINEDGPSDFNEGGD